MFTFALIKLAICKINSEKDKGIGAMGTEFFCIQQISIVMKKYCLEHEANISKSETKNKK